MPDQNDTSPDSLALLKQALASHNPAISAAPNAAGYGSAFSGLLGQAVKSFQANNLRNKAIDLISREQLANKFDKIASDPRYDNDIQLEAEQHANTLRLHEVDKKLDKDYQPDKKDGTIPAMNRLLYKHVSRETARRGGEPPPPAEPPPPPPPADPGSAMGLGMSGGIPFHPISAPPGQIAPPPSPPSSDAGAGDSGGIPPAPGGVQLGPNAITPGPAVPAPNAPADQSIAPPPPPMPASMPASMPGMDTPPSDSATADSSLVPRRRNEMEQAQHEAEINSAASMRQLTPAEAQMLGKPELAGQMVHKDLIPSLTHIQEANIRANTTLTTHGYSKDAQGHIVPTDPSQLSEHDRAYIARTNSQVDLNHASAQWKEMLTKQGPERTRIAAQQAASARERADAAMKKVVEDVRQGMVKYPEEMVGGGYARLNSSAQNKLQEIIPRQREASELMQVFEPFKNDNQPFENSWKRFEYAFGRNPEGAIGNYISEIELFRVQAVASLTKGQSRSLQVYEKAALHAPSVSKDSPMQMYRKIQVIRKVLGWQADDAVRFGNKEGLVKLSDLRDAGPYDTEDTSIPPPPTAVTAPQDSSAPTAKTIPAKTYDDMLAAYPKRADEIKKRYVRGQ